MIQQVDDDIFYDTKLRNNSPLKKKKKKLSCTIFSSQIEMFQSFYSGQWKYDALSKVFGDQVVYVIVL